MVPKQDLRLEVKRARAFFRCNDWFCKKAALAAFRWTSVTPIIHHTKNWLRKSVVGVASPRTTPEKRLVVLYVHLGFALLYILILVPTLFLLFF